MTRVAVERGGGDCSWERGLRQTRKISEGIKMQKNDNGEEREMVLWHQAGGGDK
jgi:hypothetical protein